MPFPHYPSSLPWEVPAECFNRARLLRRRSSGYLELPLPGLSDNLVILGEQHWRCWNRRLNVLMLTWDGFRKDRNGLCEPVPCVLTGHHPYCRTIVHRVHASLNERLLWELALQRQGDNGAVLCWPEGRTGT